MDKVESVKINESILGAQLDDGDATILGTGEGFETPCIIVSRFNSKTASQERRTKLIDCLSRWHE